MSPRALRTRCHAASAASITDAALSDIRDSINSRGDSLPASIHLKQTKYIGPNVERELQMGNNRQQSSRRRLVGSIAARNDSAQRNGPFSALPQHYLSRANLLSPLLTVSERCTCSGASCLKASASTSLLLFLFLNLCHGKITAIAGSVPMARSRRAAQIQNPGFREHRPWVLAERKQPTCSHRLAVCFSCPSLISNTPRNKFEDTRLSTPIDSSMFHSFLHF